MVSWPHLVFCVKKRLNCRYFILMSKVNLQELKQKIQTLLPGTNVLGVYETVTDYKSAHPKGHRQFSNFSTPSWDSIDEHAETIHRCAMSGSDMGRPLRAHWNRYPKELAVVFAIFKYDKDRTIHFTLYSNSFPFHFGVELSWGSIKTRLKLVFNSTLLKPTTNTRYSFELRMSRYGESI